MSEAKVLSTKQQRKTLSNAKKKKKAPARNVYGHPRKDYWPVLNEEDENSLLNLFTKLFRASRDVKNLNGSSSSSAKNLTSDSKIVHQPALHHDSFSNQLVVGLRKVIVEIESGSLKGLFLDNSVDPPSLGHIVGNLATAHNVPFIAISNLKSCLQDLLGFKSWCVGFKVTSEHFNPICEKIKIFLLNMQHEPESQQQTFLNCENAKKSRFGGSPEEKSKNMSQLYFYRSDKSKRMFVPESSSSQSDSDGLFLSFSKDPSDNLIYQKEISWEYQNKPGLVHKLSPNSKQSKQYPRYFNKVELLPLQVKRFQENPNKQTWKKSKNRSYVTTSKLCEGT